MIDELLSTTPHKPGCYLMKDKNGCIIYVGKSKNLKNRLSSYFKQSHTGKTKMLVRDIVTFEYILTNSEMESFIAFVLKFHFAACCAFSTLDNINANVNKLNTNLFFISILPFIIYLTK